MTLRILFAISIALTICSCNNQKVNSQSSVDSIKIQRFDKDLYRLIESNDSLLQQQIISEYPQMLEILGKAILNIQDPNSPILFEKLINFYSEPTLNQLYQKSIKVYNSVDDIEKQLEQGFSYLKENIPTLKVPNIYMHVSGFNQNVLVGENLLSVSIDKYLGSDLPLYQEFFYDYQRQKMQRSNVAPDYLTGWLISEFPFKGKENVLLDRMIYEGKIIYLVSQALPEIKPYVLMGYSEDAYNWCKNNEATIWKAIIERKHLYTPDLLTTSRYFEDTPSIFLSDDAPGNLGKWIGWKIIDHYMKETKSTPKKLLEIENAQEILTAAKYKP